MRKFALLAFIGLTACVDEPRQPGECPVLYSEFGRQLQAECERAAMEAKARAEGKPVTTCVRSPSGMTCVTE